MECLRRRSACRDRDWRSTDRDFCRWESILSKASKNTSDLEIELPNQVKVRVPSGCDLELLRQVLQMLQQDSDAEGC